MAPKQQRQMSTNAKLDTYCPAGQKNRDGARHRLTVELQEFYL